MTEIPEDAPLIDSQRAWRAMVRRFAALVLGEAGARAFGLVATIVLARQLGPGFFGVITLGVTMLGWFALVVDSGTEVLNVRDMAREPDTFRERADPVLGLRLALSVVCAVLLVVGAFLFARSPATRDVYARFAIVLPAIALNLRWMVLGVGGARAVAAGNVASRAVFMVGVILLVSNPHDVFRVPLLEAAGETVYAVVILALLAQRFGIARPRVDLARWRATLRESAPLMVNASARAAILGFDILLIDIVLGPAKLGFYGAALKPVVFVLGALGLLSMSFLSSYSAATPEHAEALFVQTSKLLLRTTVLGALVLSAGASFVVPLLYGDEYTPAVAALALAAWTIPFVALGMPYANALVAGHRQGVLARNTLVVAACAVGADLVVVPVLGINGAAAVRIGIALLALALNARSATSLGLAPRVGRVLGRRATPERLPGAEPRS